MAIPYWLVADFIMKNIIANRIKITKTGKLLRRPMGLGHNKSKKTGRQNQHKRKKLAVNAADLRMFKKYL